MIETERHFGDSTGPAAEDLLFQYCEGHSTWYMPHIYVDTIGQHVEAAPRVKYVFSTKLSFSEYYGLFLQFQEQ